MGNYLSSDLNWHVYRRALSTDEWTQAALQTWGALSLEDALSQFKHEVFTFALAKHTEYEDTKAIYLYHGNHRIAKARLDPETKQVEVWSSSIREWLSCPEKLASQRYPKHETEFFSKYVKEHAWINTQTITFVHKE
tara:strand:+ start:985 stop:1395 length:411 start_codon:yes stop_codon:yes gene_type:complete